MRKPAAKNVTVGMIYELVSYDKNLAFGMGDLGEFGFQTGCTPTLGVQIEVVKAPYKDHAMLVDWRIIGDTTNTVWSSFWSIFKDNTNFISGTVKPSVPVAVVSNNKPGTFNGSDVKVAKTEIHDYADNLGYGELSIYIEFNGEFTGTKKLSTKHINQIKIAPGFKAHILSLIDTELSKNKKQLDRILKKTAHTKGMVHTWYSGGKVQFEISIATSLSDMKDCISSQVDCFIASNRTNTQFKQDVTS